MARGPVYNIAVSDKARAVRYMFMADQPIKRHDKERQQIAKEARRDVLTTVGWKLISEARMTASDLKQTPKA